MKHFIVIENTQKDEIEITCSYTNVVIQCSLTTKISFKGIPGTEIVVACTKCYGRGYIEVTTHNSDGGSSSRKERCSLCNGSGKKINLWISFVCITYKPYVKFQQGSLLEFVVVMSEYFDNENYFIHGRNPNLPEENILKVQGEILMQETNYRVGGVSDFTIEVFEQMTDVT